MSDETSRGGPVAPENAARMAAVPAQVLAFFTAFVTLAVQVLVYRLVSAKLVNNYAFLVVSFTMLGFALSGVVLTRASGRLLARSHDTVLGAAALFGISLLAVSAAFCHATPGAQWVSSAPQFVVAFARLLPLAFLYSLPFACCGLILGLLLSSPGLNTARIYGSDLMGSALGALAVVPAIGGVGVERGLLLCACLLLLVAAVVTTAASAASRLAAMAAGLVLFAAFPLSATLFRMSYPEGSFLAVGDVAGSGVSLEHVGWDPIARIEVSRIPPPRPETVAWPFLIGDDASFLARFERVVTQNNTAFTYAPRFAGPVDVLAGMERTLYSAAYAPATVPRPRVLVVGVGGGLDVLAALHHGAVAVTGVEINAETLRVVRHVQADYFDGWVEDPRVRLVAGEGRQVLATHADRYDVLQLTGVDTASGTPAAAHVFSESYLYTAEAFDLYLSRLSDAGVLNMMRSEWANPPREMLRALVTAVEALRRAGATRPERHIVTVTAHGGVFTAMLVKRTPFLDAEEARVARWADGNPFFSVSAAPGLNARRENVYQAFLDLGDAAAQRRFVARYPFDIRPVTDDRPFFFRHSYWWHLTSGAAMTAGVPVMEIGLGLLLATSLLATVVLVYLPLRFLSGEGVATAGAARDAGYFGMLGLGYIAVEMALLQRFGLFLGHPNYALSVVLAGLLVGTGIGALQCERLVRSLGGPRFVAYALAFLILAEDLLLLPRLAALAALPLAARAAVVCVLVLPVGAALGTFFPWGLERLQRSRPRFVPWAWGLNGMASVIAPILAVGVSVTWGIEALLISAIPIYLVAGMLAPPAVARIAS